MIIVALVVLGLCIGSFINALVWRLHQQEPKVKSPKPDPRNYSILSGRSVCTHCGHRLAVKDLVPIVSWVRLGGRCRYCNKPISAQYPLIEALTAGLFLFSYIFWPYELISAENTAAFIVWLVFLTGFIALVVYDLKYLILPNRIIFPLLALAAGSLLVQYVLTYDLKLVISAVWGGLVGGGLFYLLFQFSGGKWIGGGDVKLGFLLGIVVGGPWPAALILFLASLLGTFYSLPLLAAKKIKPKSRIPFGPFLIISAVIVQLFGTMIIDWYGNLVAVSY